MSDRYLEASVIFGCGDVGRRIVNALNKEHSSTGSIIGYVNSIDSQQQAASLGVHCEVTDLDNLETNSAMAFTACHAAKLYYTVAPQKQGLSDQRSRALIKRFMALGIRPAKVVLISTTGVYGDYDGEWVSELSVTEPQTVRGQRRLDSERQWLAWGKSQDIAVVVLRAPGIYAFSRLPRARIERKTPVVRASECGFSNRVHADDLASMCVMAMRKAPAGEVYNATDGTPGKISEYLQAVAQALDYPPLPEISMSQAQQELSLGMLSYLSESRKISNRKILEGLGYELLYPDFKHGLCS
ncbi:MAG: nucleoside-diphosphate-sugar epimerase [Arenicella sp.]|jgi:nucleoside-diphosphate-sugar epimerase